MVGLRQPLQQVDHPGGLQPAAGRSISHPAAAPEGGWLLA
jgi:hypothetical protein